MPQAGSRADFIGDGAFARRPAIYAASLYRDTVLVVNPQSGMVIGQYKTGRRPYRILFHPDGKSFFVTHWADGSVGQYDANTGSPMGPPTRVGAHASDMVWRSGAAESAEGDAGYTARVFVAAASTNNVFALGVSTARELSVVENINVAMTARQPLGMTPSGLGLSADGKRLFVACSDANAAAVIDVSESRSRVEGFIPTGWYPTAVRALANGTVVVLNGRGCALTERAEWLTHKRASQCSRRCRAAAVQFVGRIQTGDGVVDRPFTVEQLNAWTARTLAIPRTPTRNSMRPIRCRIEHVIYVVKENRTYDQVLGDMKEGNGDASLALSKRTFRRTITSWRANSCCWTTSM